MSYNKSDNGFDYRSIHDFEYNLIYEYFSDMERQGPGSPEVTVKALGFIENLTDSSIIADIGCGTGGQTIVLANNTRGNITGYDLSPVFIEILNKRSKEKNLQNRVKGVVCPMENLPFRNEELDLIWSEGAIYNIGFEKGMNSWHRFLKKGAYIAVSEASWLTEKRPIEIEGFWNDAYSEINTIPEKISIMQKAGYTPVAAFVLPEICWTRNFLEPQISCEEKFLKKYKGNENARQLVDNLRHETDMYYRYKEFYGYVFYIGKKN